MIIITNIEQGSEAWHNLRVGRITGTRFKDLMASDSTKAYNDLIYDLANDIIKSDLDSLTSYKSEAMQRGHLIEPIARKFYEDEFDTEVKEVGFVLMDEGAEFYDWVGISPDGLTESGGVEIKCPLDKAHLGYIIKGVVPSEYRWQVQGNMFVTKAESWDFLSYHPDMKPFILNVKANPKDQKAIAERLRATIKKVLEIVDTYDKYEYSL